MEANTSGQANQDQLAIIQKKIFLDQKIKTGLNWFYWIGAMSILNSIIAATGSSVTFVIGLGITQFIDGFMRAMADDLGGDGSFVRVIGWVIDIAIAGIFIILGILSKKRIRWLIITGMVIYAFDALLMILFKDILGMVFHGLAIVGIWGALKNMKQLQQLEEINLVESIESLRMRMPAIAEVKPKTRMPLIFWLVPFGILAALGVFLMMMFMMKF